MSAGEQTTLDKLGTLKTGDYIKFSSDPLSKFSVNFVPEKFIKGQLYVDGSTKYLDTNIKNKPFLFNTVLIKAIDDDIYASILRNTSYLSHTAVNFAPNQDVCDSKFIKYCFNFSYVKEQYQRLHGIMGTKRMVSTKNLLLIFFPKPPLDIQRKIGSIIADYDLLLENYEKQINLLRKVRSELFLEGFIQDNFPKHIVNPIFGATSSNGKRLPLKSIVEFKEGKRLSEEVFDDGIYPLFGASQKIVRKIDTYSYDKEALLLAGAGSIRHVKYYSGKFEVMRHIYILSPEHKYIFGLFEIINYFILLFDKLFKGKVPQTGDIKNFVVSLPPDDLLGSFNYFYEPIQKQIDNLVKKVDILKEIKSELIEEIYSQKIRMN